MSFTSVVYSLLLVASLLALATAAPSMPTADLSVSEAAARRSGANSAIFRRAPDPSETAFSENPVINTSFIALLLENINESTPIPFHAAVRVPRSSNSRRQHYCGNVLKDVLKLICAGRYNDGANNTRTRQSYNQNANNGNFVEATPVAEAASVANPMDVTSSLLVQSAEHLSSGGLVGTSAEHHIPKSRTARGIVDECCKKPCTITDLRMYCMID